MRRLQRIVSDASQREIDLLAGLAWREERVDLIGYPHLVMGSESYYFVKYDEDTGITADPSTMNGKKIGVLDSVMVTLLNRYLEEHDVSAEVEVYPDHIQLFSAFDSRSIDILVAESDGARGRDHAQVLCSFGGSDYYLCVSKNRPDLLAELNEAQALLASEEPNYLNSLKAKYYSVSVNAMAFSSAEREWMDSHSALHIGYLENYLPYSDTDDKGQANGLIKDIVPEMLNVLGISDMAVSYTGYSSYDDMIAAMGSGVIDAAFPVGGGLYYSEENGIYQSNPVVSSSTELVFKGAFTEGTTSHFAVNENNRMQYYYICSNYPDAEI
ncbi:MAG: transporter substrate-binding domain-containing protein [Oscillospiraceae bacterium]|nr:transporter substrate-binding domain-containing protein [Oscillospiraceae bacterium]